MNIFYTSKHKNFKIRFSPKIFLSTRMVHLHLLLFIPVLLFTQNPGNIMFQPLPENEKILFIRIIYPDDNTVILTDERAPLHADGLKELFEINSYGRYNIDIDITPILTMPQPSSFYELENRLSFVRLRSDAWKIAEDAGYKESDYDREAIFTIKIWPHPFLGIGGVNRRTYYSSRDNVSLSAHELGHTFDWRHANFWRVMSDNPIDEEGELIEYGDKFDIMGDALNPHHFNPWYKTRSGWIPKENVLTVQESGNYTIQALENEPESGTEITAYSGLRVRKETGVDYLIYYRSQEEDAKEGAMISQAVPRNTAASILLDMNPFSLPQNQDYKDAALKVGQTFSDSAAGVVITLIDKEPDLLHLNVIIPEEQVPRLPAINITSPAFSTGIVSNDIEYSATAFDPDFGVENGDGIDTVLFVWGYPEGDDPFGEGTTFIRLMEHVFTEPPYQLQVDTKTLPDESYRFMVFAKTPDGRINTGVLNHIIDNTGPSDVSSSVFPVSGNSKDIFELAQNFPNPFFQSTKINYTIKRTSAIELNIYDVHGRTINTLIKEKQMPGNYSVSWDGHDNFGNKMESGTFFYELKTGINRSIKKMIILN